MLSGLAPDAVSADRAVSIAKTMVKSGEIVNTMTVAPSQQVMLKVRFLEAAVPRSATLASTGLAPIAMGLEVLAPGLASPMLGLRLPSPPARQAAPRPPPRLAIIPVAFP